MGEWGTRGLGEWGTAGCCHVVLFVCKFTYGSIRNWTMRFGLHLPHYSAVAGTPDDLVRFAVRGEQLGFCCLSFSDHIVIPRTVDSPYPYTADGKYRGTGAHLEQLTLLSYLAGATQRIRLVPSVMVVPHRNPIVVAKMLATLDVLSHGRLTLGVGTGWMREEFEVLGLPFFEARGAVTDEYIRAWQELWTSDNPVFNGQYCSFSQIVFEPKPVQQPSIPIWIGGHSRRALRRVAELGDGWHPIGGIPSVPLEPERLRQDLAVLDTLLQRQGRRRADITVSFKPSQFDVREQVVGGRRRRFTGSAEAIASDIRTYEDAGVDALIFDAKAESPNATLERIEWLAKEVLQISE